ncbi:MAG: hypothetical protein PSV22_09075 [Pseudolabrys sp.]|nr:hypothetical protein [Pseudolabrys sp.]
MSFAVDVAIALALACTVSFFLIVMDACLTDTALTRAQLRLLEPDVQTAGFTSTPPITNAAFLSKNKDRETKENSTWPTVQPH